MDASSTRSFDDEMKSATPAIPLLRQHDAGYGAPRMSSKKSLQLLMAACLCWIQSCGDPPPEPPRSILLISLDTLRADMLNAYGYEEFPTSPFLDSFAQEAILFENSIIQEPRTLTSHMSLMTGLYPQHHRVQDETVLPTDVPTLAQYLKANGYRTQAYVDGGYLSKHWGFDRGFDDYQDDVGGVTNMIIRGMDWLRENKDEPHFLFLHTYAIHSKGHYPYYRSPPPFHRMFSKGIESDLRANTQQQFAARWAQKTSGSGELSEADKDYIRATYAEGIRFVDECLAQLFRFLEEEGIYEDALVVVWSDHGEGLLDHELWSHGELFDHTIRAPLIMKIPGRADAGKRVRSVVSSIDITPTVLDLIGEDAVAPMDGESLLPLLEQEQEERLAYSIRAKDTMRRYSVRSLSHHFYWDENENKGYLYDLTADPRETNNLYPDEATAGELQGKLFEWIEAYERTRAAESEQSAKPLDAEITDNLRALGYVE